MPLDGAIHLRAISTDQSERSFEFLNLKTVKVIYKKEDFLRSENLQTENRHQN